MTTEAPPLQVTVESLQELWDTPALACDEDGCSTAATWLCRCPFEGCEYRLHLCDLHTATARDVVLQLLAKRTAFVGCPRCLQPYPRQGPFRRWVHL